MVASLIYMYSKLTIMSLQPQETHEVLIMSTITKFHHSNPFACLGALDSKNKMKKRSKCKKSTPIQSLRHTSSADLNCATSLEPEFVHRYSTKALKVPDETKIFTHKPVQSHAPQMGRDMFSGLNLQSIIALAASFLFQKVSGQVQPSSPACKQISAAGMNDIGNVFSFKGCEGFVKKIQDCMETICNLVFPSNSTCNNPIKLDYPWPSCLQEDLCPTSCMENDPDQQCVIDCYQEVKGPANISLVIVGLGFALFFYVGCYIIFCGICRGKRNTRSTPSDAQQQSQTTQNISVGPNPAAQTTIEMHSEN